MTGEQEAHLQMDRELSQRTLVRIVEVLDEYFNPGNETVAEMDSPWSKVSRFLYEHDFKDWFVGRTRYYSFDWFSIVQNLRSGKFLKNLSHWQMVSIVDGYAISDFEAKSQGEQLLQRLAALVTILPNGAPVARSLELDGFRVKQETLELVAVDSIVSETEEQDRLTSLVNATALPNATTILRHVSDAKELFIEGKDHSSVNESRNFLQAIIEIIGAETSSRGVHTRGYPGGMKGRLEYLEEVGFFTGDERTAFESAWGFISAGSHPGIPTHDEARIGLILALEFCLLLMLKFQNWKANDYTRFTP